MLEKLPIEIRSLDDSAITALISPGKSNYQRDKVHTRAITYLATAGLLLIIHVASLTIPLKGAAGSYLILETVAVLLSFVVSVMALIKFRTRHLYKYRMIGYGFLAVALFDLLYLIISFVSPESFTQQSILAHWTISQLILAVFVFASLLVWKYNSAILNHKFTQFGPLIIAPVILIIAYSMPHRFTGLLLAGNAMIFLATAIGYIVKGFWTRKYFEHWFVVALFIFLYAEFVRFSSAELFDTPLLTAHLLKIFGTITTLTGLLMSMYIAFKQVEEAGNKINTILASVGDGVIVLDHVGKMILMNPVAETLTGRKVEDVYNTQIEDSINITNEHGRETLSRSITHVLAKRKPVFHDHQLLIQQDGRGVHTSYSIAPIIESNDTLIGFALVIHDSSHEHELEQTKNNFISVVAHQLRTPLGAMRWNLELLLADDFGKLSNKMRTPIDDTYQNNHRMINLVNDLLNVLRIDQRRVADSPKHIDLYKKVKSAVTGFRFEALSRNITLILTPPKPFPSPIKIDPERFTEIIENVVANAIKYNIDNGKVTVTITPSTTNYKIQVDDTGIGIPRIDRGNIFSRFYRATNARTSHTGGTGLGLFVVKSYIQGWGGSITFSSVENKGTTIVLTIPKKPKRLKPTVLAN